MSFLTSKFSGYLSLILLALLIAGAWYMYQRGVTFGELKRAAEQLEQLEQEREARAQQLAKQVEKLAQGRKEAARLRKELQEAQNAASSDFNRCFNMPVPDGMRIQQ